MESKREGDRSRKWAWEKGFVIKHMPGRCIEADDEVDQFMLDACIMEGRDNQTPNV